MSLIVLRYEYLDYTTNPEACFGSEASEEMIELHGQLGSDLEAQEQDASLRGVNSTFSQKILIDSDRVKLQRTFFLDERRADCPHAERESQKKFFSRIKELKARTHAPAPSSNTK
jgi:hypothetical protein